MTTDSFAEFLNKLKEIHEKEVQGKETRDDAQRIEELFAKNHQLREQQKVLKENVKVLENRLRAGLCDRCMVTQELAKKKQNEYESSHFQSLQHIFILTNEMNRLKEENKTLKEDVKRLRSLEIANQLHGTIALVRPGSKPCLLEKSPPGAAPSPSARKTPLPSSEREHRLMLPIDFRSRALSKVAPSYENLKLTARTEQLCLLNKHFSLHQLGLVSNYASADRDSSFSSQFLRAKDAEGSMRSRDDWEDRAAIFKLPAAVVYMRDQHLEGKLHFLKHRERLQHFLAHQRQQGLRARVDSDPKPTPEERPLSPWLNVTPGCKEERSFLEDSMDGKDEKELWLSRDGSKRREKAEAARDYGTDMPLDLSDSGRGRETSWPSSPEPREAGHGRLSPGESPAALAARGSCGRHRVAAPYEHNIPQEAQAEGKYFCAKDRAHVLLKKRKRAQDPWTKGRKEEFLMGSDQGYNFRCFLRGSFQEKHPRAPSASPSHGEAGGLLPNELHAANKCLPKVIQWSLLAPRDKTCCTMFWQRVYLQPGEPPANG
uniref:RBBP8 N-terminal like n=1 Tax=Apteryx owenii TaxID=8824 RepID=A0A8B9NP61_APTOW